MFCSVHGCFEIAKHLVETSNLSFNLCAGNLSFNLCEGHNKAWQEEATTIKELHEALRESVRLQAHYAELLNMHDGGERIVFKSVEDWIDRLKKIGRIKPGG